MTHLYIGNRLVRSGSVGETVRRGWVRVGALGDTPAPAGAAAAAPAALPAGLPAATPAAAASPPAAAPAAPAAPAGPTSPTGDKPKDKAAAGPMATFEALPTVAKVGIGAGVAVAVVGVVAVIVAASK